MDVEERRTVRVLLVDDEIVQLHLLTALLETEGFAVTTARGGAEAAEVLRADRGFALVLTDVEMPGMNGLELFAMVRREIGIPVVLMTAHDEKEIPWNSPERPNGTVTKPVRFDDLVAQIRAIVGSIR